MADELVLDAPVLDEVEDQVQDEPIEGEGAEDRPEGDATEEAVQETEGDGRKLPQWIRDLKATSPEAYKQAKGVFFGKDALDAKLKDFDLDGTKSWLEEKGGRESLETAFTEMEAKAQELDGINEAIAAANPDLIKEIADLHPESFPKLAVTALNEWSSRDPEGYARVISGVFANAFNQGDLENPSFASVMQRMEWNLGAGRMEEAKEDLKQLRNWVSYFGQAAKTPQNQPRQNDQVSQREQSVAQKERQIYTDNYLAKLDTQRKPMIEEALKDYIAQRPDSPGTKDRAIKAAIESIESTLGKDQQFIKAVQAFHAKGDAEGALRLVKSREAKVLEPVAKAVGEDFYGKLGPKVTPKSATQQRASQAQQKRPQATPAKPKDKFAEIFASA